MLHHLLQTRFFLLCYRRLTPWAVLFGSVGFIMMLYHGLLFGPQDYQQGDAVRIMYVHVPAAAFSLSCYALMAVMASIYWIWHIKVADMIAVSAARLGLIFTFIALITGSLWGKPMWGTWWIWDARLTSELVLAFMYIGYLLLRQMFDDWRQAAKASAIVAWIGAIDLPIIHYSVQWWNTLHQGSTVLAFAKPKMAWSMLKPLLWSFFAFFWYSVAIMLWIGYWEYESRQANHIKT